MEFIDFATKYSKESSCIELVREFREQELCDVGNYSSNLEKAVDFAIGLCVKSLKMWHESNLLQKQVFQNLLFPEGIYYNRENDRVRTTRVNSFFSLIPEIAKVSTEHKKRGSDTNIKTPNCMAPFGSISCLYSMDYKNFGRILTCFLFRDLRCPNRGHGPVGVPKGTNFWTYLEIGFFGSCAVQSESIPVLQTITFRYATNPNNQGLRFTEK